MSSRRVRRLTQGRHGLLAAGPACCVLLQAYRQDCRDAVTLSHLLPLKSTPSPPLSFQCCSCSCQINNQLCTGSHQGDARCYFALSLSSPLLIYCCWNICAETEVHIRNPELHANELYLFTSWRKSLNTSSFTVYEKRGLCYNACFSETIPEHIHTFKSNSFI